MKEIILMQKEIFKKPDQSQIGTVTPNMHSRQTLPHKELPPVTMTNCCQWES